MGQGAKGDGVGPRDGSDSHDGSHRVEGGTKSQIWFPQTMRHRLANKSLSRPTAHRLLMLRNLVSSLLEHEQITTTVAKAKETQKLAEKVIGWGKAGSAADWNRANAFLLNAKSTLPTLFTTFADRYAERVGGYTRLHRAGHRQGDYAALAVLELVDSPHDLKFEAAASSVGRELAVRSQQGAGKEAWWDFRKSVEGGEPSEALEKLTGSTVLDALTRKNVGKALAFRKSPPTIAPTPNEDGTPSDESLLPAPTPTSMFLDRAHEHYLRNLASFAISTSPIADPLRQIKQLTQRLNPSDLRGAPHPVLTLPQAGRKVKAGERTDGWASNNGALSSREGGPIGRAKGSRGREGRHVEWTGTKRVSASEEGEVL